MKSMILGILLFQMAHLCLAQEADSLANDAQLPRWILRTNLLSPINPFKQSASLTAEYPLLPQLSVEASLVYTYHADRIFIDQNQESYRGPQFRLGLRYYYYQKKSNHWYFGLEVKHERITHQVWSNVLRQGGQYSEVALVPRKLTTWGSLGKMGFLFFLDPSKRFFMDLNFGLGVNRHFVKYDLPPDGEARIQQNGFGGFLHPEGLSSLPSLVWGVHLGYAFW